MCSLSRVGLFVTPWTVAHQAPLSMKFSRQDHWRGLPFPPPEDLPDPRIKPTSPALAGKFFTTESPEKQVAYVFLILKISLWVGRIMPVSQMRQLHLRSKMTCLGSLSPWFSLRFATSSNLLPFWCTGNLGNKHFFVVSVFSTILMTLSLAGPHWVFRGGGNKRTWLVWVSSLWQLWRSKCGLTCTSSLH